MTWTLVTGDELRDALDLPVGVDMTQLDRVASAASTVVSRWLDPAVDHTGHPADQEAALTVAVQVYAARTAPGGQQIVSDMGTYTSPHLLGPGLIARVMGLIGGCRVAGGVTVA